MAFDATLVTADAFTVVPSDTTPVTAYGFYVGDNGNNVVIKTLNGTLLTFTAVPGGTQVYIGVSRFMAATTSAQVVAFGPS